MEVVIAVLVAICAGLALFLIKQMSENHILKRSKQAAEKEAEQLKNEIDDLRNYKQASEATEKNKSSRKPDMSGVFRR